MGRGAKGGGSEGDRGGEVRSRPGRGHAEPSGPLEGFWTYLRQSKQEMLLTCLRVQETEQRGRLEDDLGAERPTPPVDFLEGCFQLGPL